LGGRGRQISEFEASLVYKVSSRTARATQRNHVSKNQKKKKKKKPSKILTGTSISDSSRTVSFCQQGKRSKLHSVSSILLENINTPTVYGGYIL
jgi:hypothetical protein